MNDEMTQDSVTTADGQTHPDLPPLALERGKDLDALLTLLNDQQAVKYDCVVNAAALRYEEGKLVVDVSGEPLLGPDGVQSELTLAPTSIFEDQLAGRLEIPSRYLRRLRVAAHADEYGVFASLMDRNVNAWLHDDPTRKFTVRGFYNGETGDGIARAIMSGRYEVVDHLDQLTAVLGGVKKVAETNPEIDPDTLSWKVDLTEGGMRVRLIAPQIELLAPAFLDGYKDPWGGRYGGSTGDQPPILQAGLDIRNSETGGGAWTLAPFIHVLMCTNGMTMTKYGVRRVHAGGEKVEGRLRFSVETQRKVIDLITSQTADAVSQYLSVDWLNEAMNEIQEMAVVDVPDAKATCERVAAVHKFSEDEQASIFELFLRSGSRNAGGIAQAITAHAHTAQPTRAMELDDMAVAAMETAARYAMAN